MSKKLLAVAIAAVLVPAAAMAEDSNVTVYGRIDYGFLSRSGNDGAGSKAGIKDRKNEFTDGIAGGNRIGFKGSEALGNGLKAIFELEFGFSGDSENVGNAKEGKGIGFNRHTWVGLETPYGTVLGGRVDGARYSFTGQYDPFKNQTVGNAASVFGLTSGLGQADRADNAIVYISPEVVPGLKFLGAYTKSLLTQEGQGFLGVAPGAGVDVDSGDTPLYAVAAMYNNGPISVTLDYENLQVKNVGLTGGDLEFNIWVAGASYDFGFAKISGYYENTRGDTRAARRLANNVVATATNPTGANLSSDGEGWFIGATVPVTANIKVLASYVQGSDDRANNRDVKKVAVGAEYAFSKRTYLYATWAKMDVDSGVSAGITTAGRSSAAPSSTGAYGDTGFNLGVAHTF
jgi:predicted porin